MRKGSLMDKQAILELLAENEHATWSSWMLYLFEKSNKNEDGTVTIPKWAVDGWTRQANTPYSELSEDEKESDRREVRHLIPQILTAQEGGLARTPEEAEALDCACDINTTCTVCSETSQEGDRLFINSKDWRIKQYITDNDPEFELVDEDTDQ